MNSRLVTIGVAARASGVPAWRLRAWESAGLLAPLRTATGYRLYGESDIERAKLLAREVDGGDRLRGMALAHEASTGSDPIGAPAVTRSSEQFDLLRETAHLLSVGDDTRSAVGISVARTAQYIEADAWSLTLADPIRQEVEVYAAFGLSEQFTRELGSWPFRQGFGGQVYSLREPISIPDLQPVARAGREMITAEGLRAYACIPLTQGSERLGILEMYRRSADAFALREIALLETTASLITPRIRVERLSASVGALREERSRHFRTLVSQFAAAGRRQREDLAAELRRIAVPPVSQPIADGEVADGEIVDRVIRLARGLEQGRPAEVDFVELAETGILDRLRREHGLTCSLDVAGWPRSLSAAFTSRLYLLLLGLAEEVALTATGDVVIRLDSTHDSIQFSIEYGTSAARTLDPHSPSAELLDLIDEADAAFTASHGPASSSARLTIPRESERHNLEALTLRERETLSALRDGLSNRETAARLGISVKTLQNHLTALYRKLGVSSRGEAISLDLDVDLDPKARTDHAER